jgi:hypothetical protein
MSLKKEEGGALLILLLLFVTLLSAGIWWKVGHQVSDPSPVEACTERGIAYFKEIGSWPTLKTYPSIGRPAEEVAKERCSRATTAF